MKINGMTKFITTTIVVLFVTLVTTTMMASADCRNSDCHKHEMCVKNKCVHGCSITPPAIAKNAICTAYDHIPHWDCPEGYSGRANHQCTKSCDVHKDCASTDLCVHGECTFGCDWNRCKPEEHCDTENHIVYCLS